MKSMRAWGGKLGVCLAGAWGCWQGRAGDGVSTEPRDVVADTEDVVADTEDDAVSDPIPQPERWTPLRSESIEGETFYRIWGTSDDLWVLGGPRLPLVEGSGEQAEIPLILYCGEDRWDADVVVRRNVGDGWRDMEVPATTSLSSLHGTDASNVWTVGLDGAAVQFDGDGWIEHDVRGAAGLEFQEAEQACSELSLHSVFARSPSDVWAVGYIYPSSLGPGLILHYDGSEWQRHPTGAPDGFFAVWAASASDAWAVGSSGLAYHFDGTSWSQGDAKTSQYLHSVWGTAPGDVWATGNAAVTARFDGAQWHLVQPERENEAVRGLAGDAAAGVWSLSTIYSPDTASTRQALSRWSDSGWEEQVSIAEPEDQLGGIWVTPDGQVWGAGNNIVRLR